MRGPQVDKVDGGIMRSHRGAGKVLANGLKSQRAIIGISNTS